MAPTLAVPYRQPSSHSPRLPLPSPARPQPRNLTRRPKHLPTATPILLATYSSQAAAAAAAAASSPDLPLQIAVGSGSRSRSSPVMARFTIADGESSDCEVIPTREIGQFHFRVCFSPIEVPFSITKVASSVVAGCKCDATFFRCDSAGEFSLTLMVRHVSNPTMEGIKVLSNIVLLDKTGSPAPAETRTTGCLFGDTQSYHLRLPEDVKANCLVDDYFRVMCSVEVIGDGATEEEEELPDLRHDLAMIRDKQELTDVSFDVDGESFCAHRLVLAALSPVFRAELYGSMAESKMASITIQDMGASTFRSMLHYMYHGSLTNAGKTGVPSTMAEYQRLLVAADRYGVDRLKKICEDKLCGNGITVDNAVSMLELAEGHVCPKLKASCLDFLSDGENFKMVATTDTYFNLIQSVPSILVEIRNRFSMAHENPTSTEHGAHKKSRMC